MLDCDWLIPGSVGDGAEREVDLRRKEIQSAVNTGVDTRVDQLSWKLAREFSKAVVIPVF